MPENAPRQQTPHHHGNQSTAQANKAVALAALVQATSLVERIARSGIHDQDDFKTCIASLFSPEHDHVAASYGGLEKLQSGLYINLRLLKSTPIKDAKPILTYSAGLMALEKKLSKDKKMLITIGEGMQRIKKQSDYFGSLTHESVIGGLSGLYAETISTMNPRIIVRGKQEHLSHTRNTNKVRALLFAGIRAAHFWRKHGGGHLSLLFGRKKLIQQTQALLDEANRIKGL